MKPLFILMCLFAVSAGAASARKGQRRSPTNTAPQPSDPEVTQKIQNLQSSVDKLSAEVLQLERLSDANSTPLRRSEAYANMTYLKFGFSLVKPRAMTFPFVTDSGLGLFLGAGQYFGENHVGDITLEWDLYPALSVRYRYEFHIAKPAFTIAPVVGYKIRAGNMRPLDNFLERPDDVKNAFPFLGTFVALPLNKNLFTVELVYLFNQQAVFIASFGLHALF